MFSAGDFRVAYKVVGFIPFLDGGGTSWFEERGGCNGGSGGRQSSNGYEEW